VRIPVKLVEVTIPAGECAIFELPCRICNILLGVERNDVRLETGVTLRGCAKAIKCIKGFFGGISGDTVNEANLVEVRGKKGSLPGLNCFLVGNWSALPNEELEVGVVLNHRGYIPKSYLGKEDPHIRLSQSC
jgi:hypothetical protein